jgi:cell shape-determining protein MreD
LTLPFAALGALLAALIETTVLPELPIARTQGDLVLVLAVVAALALSAEDGLVWAFVGGLMLDMLIPARPIGATTLTLLLVVGIAALVGLLIGRPHRLSAVFAAFALTWVFHVFLLAVLVLTEGLAFDVLEPRLVLVASLINVAVAIPAAIHLAAIARRLPPERVDW